MFRRPVGQRPAARTALRRLARPLVLGVAGLGVASLAGCGEGEDPSDGGQSTLLPGGGTAPERQEEDLVAAARAAGCRLAAGPADSSEHTSDPAEVVRYRTEPPTSGRHFIQPPADGAYENPPADTALVHSLEHGRVVIWFDPKLTERQRATLMAMFSEDSYQLVLVPRETGEAAVAASAWNAEPRPLGTGRLLTCAKYTPAVIDALRAFRDEHRGRGPEAVP